MLSTKNNSVPAHSTAQFNSPKPVLTLSITVNMAIDLKDMFYNPQAMLSDLKNAPII